MKFLHSMVRVRDLDKALAFFVDALGLVETRRHEVDKGRYTLVFLATEKGAPEVELTYNWDQQEPYTQGSRSSSCKKARVWRRVNLGSRCRTLALGNARKKQNPS